MIVNAKDKSELGYADFDLSIYANLKKATGDRLIINNMEDAFVEIFININSQEEGAIDPQEQEIRD